MSKDKPVVTIKINNSDSPNPPQTAATYTITNIVGGARDPESASTSIHKWYIDHLMKMEGSTGFLVIMVLLPLYEMHLKVNGHIGKKGDFSKGHAVFKEIGRDLGIDHDEAFYFWQCFRNGLLHTGIPNESESFPYSLRTLGPPIERKIERKKVVFYINPFALRNHLLGKIEGDLKKWKSYGVNLPETYIPGQYSWTMKPQKQRAGFIARLFRCGNR